MNAITRQLLTRQKDLATQPARQFARYAGTDRSGLDIVSFADPSAGALADSLNEREDSATFVICTPSMDREGDCVMPAGCRINHYKNNPVVDYDHDQGDPLPVGLSETPEGECTVQVQSDRVIAKVFFTRLNKFGEDVANAVHRRVLRSCSVGFVPLLAEKIRDEFDFHLGKSGHGDRASCVSPRYRFSAWDLIEWSICKVPVNPEAVRIELSAGRFKDETFRKSLEPFAQKPAAWANGWTPGTIGATTMKIRKSNLASLTFAKDQYTVEKARETAEKLGLDGSFFDDSGANWLLPVTQGVLAGETKSLGSGMTAIFKAAPKDEEDDETEELDLPDPEEGDSPSPDEMADSDGMEQDEIGVPTDDDEPMDDEPVDDDVEMDDDATMPEDKAMDGDGDGDEDDGPKILPIGGNTLKNLVTSFRATGQYLKDITGQNEPEMHEKLAEIGEVLESLGQRVGEMFAERYPGHDLETILKGDMDSLDSMANSPDSDGGFAVNSDEGLDAIKKAINTDPSFRRSLRLLVAPKGQSGLKDILKSVKNIGRNHAELRQAIERRKGA